MSEPIDVEENGRRILEIFAFLNAREGDLLGANNFVAMGRRRRWDLHELQLGLDHDLATGLLERGEEGGVRLTANGLKIVKAMAVDGAS